jgi:hypothetical protein
MFTEQSSTKTTVPPPRLAKAADPLLEKINATANDNKEKLNIILGKVHD